MLRFDDARLLVFAKAPEPGLVKSRLVPFLGAQGAADLYSRMVLHTIRLACSTGLCPVELWCAPGKAHPFFRQCAEQYPILLFDQCEGGLGDRMAHGFANGLQRAASVVLIGADCPSITGDDLCQCLRWLQDDADVVLGPAEDCGYYLLGARQMISELFYDIPWGGPEVLPITRQRIERLGIECRELTTRWDVDQLEDVARLEQSGLL